MPSNCPPVRDNELLTWSKNFAAQILLAPGDFGVSPAQAAAMNDAAIAYADRLAIALTPSTRTKPAVVDKRDAAQKLLTVARQLCKIIQANPDVEDGQRIALGLPVRDGVATPVARPRSRPLLSVDARGNVRLRDERQSNRRGKPPGVFGALLFTTLGPPNSPAPASPKEAQFAAVATRPRCALQIPPNADGQTLWVIAQWINQRGVRGPMSAPVRTTIAA